MQTMARLILRFVGVDPDTDLAMFAPVDGEIPLVRLKINPSEDGQSVPFGTLVDVTFVRSSNRVVRYSWLMSGFGVFELVIGDVSATMREAYETKLFLANEHFRHSKDSPVMPGDVVRFRVKKFGKPPYQALDLEILDEDGDPKEAPEPEPTVKPAVVQKRGTLFDSMAALTPEKPVEDHGDRLTLLPKADAKIDLGAICAKKIEPCVSESDYDYLLQDEGSAADPESPATEALVESSQTRPAYYRAGDVYEPRKVIKAWGLGFNLGMVLKYACRHGKKPGESAKLDLKKAIQYLEFELEEMEGGSK